MKLLFIMQTIRARGAERVASVLTEELADMGHELHMICTGYVRGNEYPLSDKINLAFIPESEGSTMKLMFARIRWIREKIREIDPDCIISLAHARTLFMITAGHLGYRIPMIFSERHDPVHNPKSKADRLLRLISYYMSDCVVFQTEGARQFFSKSIQKKGPIIPNPIMNGLPDVYKDKRKNYIATFCKLDPQKNLSLLLRSFQKIADSYPGLRLVIYGDGVLKESLKDEAEKLGISSRTEFHPHALDVHTLINDCAMFVSSSDYEGQSNSMLEAMAMGLPCVCTDCPCGGASAVIDNGVNGLLTPVGDEEKLALAMRWMLDHPEEANQMGLNAYKIRKERAPEKIAKEWERLIRDTISKKRKRII